MAEFFSGIFYAGYIFTPILHRRPMRRYVPLCTFAGGPSPLFFTERTINSRGHWYAIDAFRVLGPYTPLRIVRTRG